MLYKYVKRDVVRNAPISSTTIRWKRNLPSICATVLCFIIGGSILTYSVYPYAKDSVDSFIGNNRVGKTLLTPSPSKNLIDGSRVQTASKEDLSNSSSSYINNVSKNFSSTNKLLNINQRTFPEYAHIQGEMKLSIPKLKLNKIPVKINVNSFEDRDYLPQLERTLAHFQGTSLPDRPGNTFIYGHSANELWAKTDSSNPKLAFSFLDRLEVGDEIFLQYQDQEYKYVMQHSQLVEPNDLSPIYTTSDAKILTLMTCWSPGIGTERLIVTAKQVG